MIDEKLNPWLLEVNLSPSLSYDSPLDQKIKGDLVSDLLNLAGIVSQDSINNHERQKKQRSLQKTQTLLAHKNDYSEDRKERKSVFSKKYPLLQNSVYNGGHVTQSMLNQFNWKVNNPDNMVKQSSIKFYMNQTLS